MKEKKNKDEFAHYKQSMHTTTTTEKPPKIFLNKCNVVKWVEKEARTSTCPLCQEVAYPKFWKLYSKNYKNYSSAFVFYALLTAYGSALT